MANRMTFDPSEGISTEQQAAETAALEQGEKLIQAQEEDRDRRMAATDSEQEDVCLLYTSPSPRDMRRSRMPSSA